MSDLVATNCGCGGQDNGCSSIVWIILLLCLCNGGSSSPFSSGCDGDNSCIWIILLLLCCGNGCSGGLF